MEQDVEQEYKTIKLLRSGKVLNLNGLLLIADPNREIYPGDLYIAERNTGPKLLTCKLILEYVQWAIRTSIVSVG